WSGYAQIFTLYAVQEATAQVGAWLGIRPPRFDPDGYANFLPEDSLYDAERAAANLPPPLPHPRSDDEPRDRADLRFPTLTRMRDMLSSLPEGTRKLVFFAPIYLGSRPPPGEPSSETLAACKARVVAIARTIPNTSVVDFTIDSPITRVPTNYWDPLHYRIGIAGQLEADLGQAARDPAALSDDYRILLP
ncbi:MAG: hypothetical protein INR70_09285, partial [Parafilimonas terrae]|nr:hypothetical protein [Parafilimonas terrae]